MTITEIVHKIMDKENPGWRDKISPDEYDDAFKDPIKDNSEDWEIQGLKQFEEWLTQGQQVKKE